MGDNPVVDTVIAIVGLLLVASASAVGLKRARLPYSVGLVIVGLTLGLLAERFAGFAVLRHVELSPDLILFVFLPTLVFESAFNLDSRLLSKNLTPVLVLAAPGLLLSTVLIGGGIAWLTDLPFGAALLFGALISATDPVAVVALFKELGAPRRLAILVEGESLFNDATAIVLFHLILAVIGGGVFTVTTLGWGALDFIRVFVGGLVVGGLIGYVMVRSIAVAEDDPLVEVALSTVVAYAAFIAAEHYLHVSGVMATVGAGVIIGVYGTPRFTPAVRAFLHQFWEYAAFVANGLIFLLVGLSVSLSGLVDYAGPIGWAILLVLVVRGLVIFGIVPVVGRLPGSEPISRGYQTVLWWGGLRGAVGLALAFTLPETFPQREVIIAMAVGVVLFTLLSGGLSMGRVISALGLDEPSLVERMARAQASYAAKGEALERLTRTATAGHFSTRLIGDIQAEYEGELSRIQEEIDLLRNECAVVQVTQALWFEAMAVEKATYRELLDQGFISEPVLRELQLALELQRDEVKRGSMELLPGRAVPVEVRVASFWNRLIGKVFPGSRLVQRFRVRSVAAQYERDLAVLEATKRVRAEVERLGALIGAAEASVAAVADAYRRRGTEAMAQIDSVAEHFPEYVEAVQLQTARRIALDGEADAVQSLVAGGGLPASVASEARRVLEEAQRRLMQQPVTELTPRPDDLLIRVPFFRNLAPDDFQQVVAKLVSRTVLADEVIIRQGDRGKSLFLIARGVVAVLVERPGQPERRIASLHAGDFFGEMALLSDQPRNATVRAVSSCQLYELSKRDVDALCEVCEGAREALVAAADARAKRKSLSQPAPTPQT